MKALRRIWLVTAISGTLLVACNDEQMDNRSGETIAISGSTSVGPLAEKLAATYEQQANVKIEVNQIGSSAGIMNAMNGVSNIGMSSRMLKEEEQKAVEKVIIAYDGIVVVTHPSNPLQNVTMAQVKQIFTGDITNWQQLGGEDLEIVVVSREDGSGSRDAFQEIVGYESGELIQNAIVASGNGNIKTTVAMNKQAIGFISFEYIDDTIAPLFINDVAPTAENVLNNTYVLARPFLFVYRDLQQAGEQFIDFILSDDGQDIVEKAGAIRLD